MTEHRLTPAYLSQIRNRFFYWGLPLIVLFILTGFYMTRIEDDVWPVILITGVTVMVAAGYGVYRGFQMQKKAWSTFRLTIDENQLHLVRAGWPDVTLPRIEISRIIESPHSGLTIQTTQGTPKIDIPVTVERYDELRYRLAGWCPIDEGRPHMARWNAFFSFLAGLLTLVGILAVHLSKSPTVIVGVGGTLGVLLVTCFIILMRQPSSHDQAKKAWWPIALLLVDIIVKIWLAANSH